MLPREGGCIRHSREGGNPANAPANSQLRSPNGHMIQRHVGPLSPLGRELERGAQIPNNSQPSTPNTLECLLKPVHSFSFPKSILMKHHGLPLTNQYTKTVALPRPEGLEFTVTIQPLPLGFHTQLAKHHIIPPSPPTRIARDNQGKPIRDEQGLAILVPDQQTPEFLTESEQYHQRVATLIIYQALKADSALEFETPPPTTEDHRIFADHLFAELQAAGWTSGDMIFLCQQIAELSNLSDKQLQQSHDHFFSTHNKASP